MEWNSTNLGSVPTFPSLGGYLHIFRVQALIPRTGVNGRLAAVTTKPGLFGPIVIESMAEMKAWARGQTWGAPAVIAQGWRSTTAVGHWGLSSCKRWEGRHRPRRIVCLDGFGDPKLNTRGEGRSLEGDEGVEKVHWDVGDQ